MIQQTLTDVKAFVIIFTIIRRVRFWWREILIYRGVCGYAMGSTKGTGNREQGTGNREQEKPRTKRYNQDKGNVPEIK